ncbi:MAG: folylpolyglutamate synthase/dihydrofolate synthase family protein [Clostridia bacterium]|nr:folylpolyglutamate synthase/dihydrofolate synthase family protein [Clostridia bacterium]
MNYEEALAYIHAVSWRGSRPGLSRTEELLRRLGNPEKELRFVHVAGTNGKGSTSAMLASILHAAGYRTGLYTSPYILRFNERIQIDGEQISDDALAELMTEIRPVADTMEDPPTEFELITCAAFLYYRKQACDIVVLEVGLGGEFDATNVIPAPVAAVITAIGYDHMQVLGPTLTEIAHAKAGILKPGVTAVSYGGEPEADAEIARVAAEKGATLISPDFSALVPGSFGLEGQGFSYKQYGGLTIPLAGRYQLKNAAVVLETIGVLRAKGFEIPTETVGRGLACVQWPARFEVLAKDPVFIVDGGHNKHGITATAESIRALFPGKKAVFLIGMMADKDVEDSIGVIAPIAERVFTVTPDNPRSMPAEELAERVRKAGVPAEACAGIPEGVERAKRAAAKTGVAVALGSLYMSGDVKRCFMTETGAGQEETKWHI